MWVECYAPLEQVLVGEKGEGEGGGGGLASSSYTSHKLHNTQYHCAHAVLKPHNRPHSLLPSRNLPKVLTF